MKFKSIIIALAAVFTLGVTASAQNPDGNKANGKKTECKKECRGDKKDCKNKKCDGRKAPNPFEGLNLTQQQQEKLAAIPCPAQVMKAARNNKTEADSMKANPALRKEMARNVRSNYLNQVKAVLTPDQYVQFLENYYVSNSAMKAKKDKNGRPGMGNKNKKMKKDSARKDSKKGNDARKDRRGGNRPQKS